MLLGYTTWGMPTVPIDIAVDHIASLGFDGLELAVTPKLCTELSTLDAAERKRIRRMIAEAGLQLSSVAGHANMLAEDPDQRARDVARLHGAIDLCVDLAIDGAVPVMTTTAGARPQDWGALNGRLVERLHALGEYAARRTLLDSRMGLGTNGDFLNAPLAAWPGPGRAFTEFGESTADGPT